MTSSQFNPGSTSVRPQKSWTSPFYDSMNDSGLKPLCLSASRGWWDPSIWQEQAKMMKQKHRLAQQWMLLGNPKQEERHFLSEVSWIQFLAFQMLVALTKTFKVLSYSEQLSIVRFSDPDRSLNRKRKRFKIFEVEPWWRHN